MYLKAGEANIAEHTPRKYGAIAHRAQRQAPRGALHSQNAKSEDSRG